MAWQLAGLLALVAAGVLVGGGACDPALERARLGLQRAWERLRGQAKGGARRGMVDLDDADDDDDEGGSAESTALQLAPPARRPKHEDDLLAAALQRQQPRTGRGLFGVRASSARETM